MGGGDARSRGAEHLSPQLEALLTLRRLCKQYPGALPSAILAEDGGLLLQLLQVDAIVDEVEAEEARQAQGAGPMTWDMDEEVYADAWR